MRIKKLYRTGILNLVFQTLFLVVMFLFGSGTNINFVSPLRYLILTILVMVSGFLWVFYFYFQDRREPEPVPYVLASFAAGMALWALAGYPLFKYLFRIREWLHASLALFVLGSFFIKAAVFTLFIYLALRYIFVPLKEFDQPVDGMVYGAVIGAGWAVLMVIYQLWNQPEVTLFTIVYTASVQVLAHSGAGALMGYFTGIAKFKKGDPETGAINAIVLGIIILGIFFLITEFIFISGFDSAFWISIAVTLAYSFLILIFCTIKMRRLDKRKLFKIKKIRFKKQLFLNLLIAGLCLTAVLITFYGQQGTIYQNREYGVRFYYPHHLSAYSFSGVSDDVSISSNSLRMVFYRLSYKAPRFTFSLQVKSRQDLLDENVATNLISFPGAENLLIQDCKVGGRSGKRISFSFEKDPEFQVNSFPKLHRIVSDMALVGQNLFIFTFHTADSDYHEGLKIYNRILNTVKWGN